MTRQVEMISQEELVPADHPYRYFKQILNESFIQRCLAGVSSDLGREGYGITPLFYGLLLQFMEDLSDRAITAELDKLNNEVLPKVACDKHAKTGCKGKN